MDPSINEIVCPIDNEWKFKKYDLIAANNFEDGHMGGKHFYAFNIHGVSYKVDIFSTVRSGFTSIYFIVNGSKERKVTGDLTASIESSDYSKKLNTDLQECNNIFFEYNVDFFESKLFVNGEITVRVKGTLKAQRPSVTILSTPVSMQWKIKEEDLKAKVADEFGCLRSKRINVASFSDVKFYLSLYPNYGSTTIDSNEPFASSVKFNVELGGEKKIEARYDFSVDSINDSHGGICTFERGFKYEHGYILGNSWYFNDNIFDPSKGYFVDGLLIINFQGILMAETNPVTVLKKGSTKAAEKEKDENFTVVVGKKEIKVHKQVIMDASSAFTAMFESGMKECTENKMFIEEEDFSFEVVDAAVKLCYNCGDLSNLNLEDFLSLYRFSDKYEIKHIMNFVEEYLIKIPSPANVCQLIHFSKVFNASKLYQSSIDFLIKCSKDSTPVSGLDILDNDLLAIIFKSTFRPVVDTDI